MTREDWRTCKQAEAEVIHVYLFECWIQECQAQEQAQEELDAQERERDRQYERDRDAGERADRFGR